MFLGRFDRFSGAPIVDCHVTIKMLDVDGEVPFLMDTGADCTVLMHTDAKRLNIDYAKLTQETTSVGVGGKSIDFVVPAALIVTENGTSHGYLFALRIAKPIPELEDAPSLLGRDIMKHWRIMCDFPSKRLEIEVISSDEGMRA